jgi:hypothetical protein
MTKIHLMVLIPEPEDQAYSWARNRSYSRSFSEVYEISCGWFTNISLTIPENSEK